MNYDDNNIFAKILRREIPSHVIFEDEHTISFMDAMPQSDGHALILPKEPSVNLLEASTESLAHSIKTVQIIARAAMQAFEADGIVVRQFNHEPAGQTVFHTHFHVIPRYEGVSLKGHSVEMADGDLLKTQATKYIDALNA